jgi:hypothetical protein
MLGLGNNLIHNKAIVGGNIVQAIVDAFKTRVLADGGTFEAESCLITQIQELI